MLPFADLLEHLPIPHLRKARASRARLDAMAAPLIERDVASRSLEDQVQLVSNHLYEDLGFRGNEQDYYDPKNSLLPDVLDRRLGIPITLALVYCEVARRAGVRARGVSFPGHFLVRVDAIGREDAPLAVDPFFGGRRLDEPELGLVATFDAFGDIALRFQIIGEQQSQIGFVFDDENARRRRCSGARSVFAVFGHRIHLPAAPTGAAAMSGRPFGRSEGSVPPVTR